MVINNRNITRWAGLSAILSGVFYVLAQIIHPAEDPTLVTSDLWAVTHIITLGFTLFGLIGLTGIYSRQVKEAGILGFVGYLAFFSAIALVAHFIFIELLILPVLAEEAPSFVADFFAIVESTSNLSTLQAVYSVVGLLYLVGGILFGISTIRANILPRIPAIVFTVGILASLTAAIDVRMGRVSAIVVGIGLIGLGYALFMEGRTQTETSVAPVNSLA